jgi:hypothetical protein
VTQFPVETAAFAGTLLDGLERAAVTETTELGLRPEERCA